MTKKQLAGLAAALLTALAGALSQCPDEPVERQGETVVEGAAP